MATLVAASQVRANVQAVFAHFMAGGVLALYDHDASDNYIGG
jgi:hypothetical protein